MTATLEFKLLVHMKWNTSNFIVFKGIPSKHSGHLSITKHATPFILFKSGSAAMYFVFRVGIMQESEHTVYASPGRCAKLDF